MKCCALFVLGFLVLCAPKSDSFKIINKLKNYFNPTMTTTTVVPTVPDYESGTESSTRSSHVLSTLPTTDLNEDGAYIQNTFKHSDKVTAPTTLSAPTNEEGYASIPSKYVPTSMSTNGDYNYQGLDIQTSALPTSTDNDYNQDQSGRPKSFNAQNSVERNQYGTTAQYSPSFIDKKQPNDALDNPNLGPIVYPDSPIIRSTTTKTIGNVSEGSRRRDDTLPTTTVRTAKGRVPVPVDDGGRRVIDGPTKECGSGQKLTDTGSCKSEARK